MKTYIDCGYNFKLQPGEQGSELTLDDLLRDDGFPIIVKRYLKTSYATIIDGQYRLAYALSKNFTEIPVKFI